MNLPYKIVKYRTITSHLTRKIVIVFSALCITVLIASHHLYAEYYKYTDDKGQTHYVDDESKIPEKYSQKSNSYKEKTDYMSDEEKKAYKNTQRQKEADRIKAQEERSEYYKQQEILKRLEKNRRRAKGAQTKVTIRGNQVIVPVTFGYLGSEVTAQLVLDTGATITLIHENIAKQLGIVNAKKASASVAGGGAIETRVARLDSVQVGPIVRQDLQVAIVPNSNNAFYDGLLGMDFLRKYHYRIDFEKQVIHWDL